MAGRPKTTTRAICRRCGRDVEDPMTVTCVNYIHITFPDGVTMPHRPYNPEKEVRDVTPGIFRGSDQRCRDCGTAPGGVHHLDCPMERCPRCGGQLIACLREGCGKKRAR